ncbi:MAG: ATPase [Firmicutes bacterium]|nr:ATPase [Bacillota bacterium]
MEQESLMDYLEELEELVENSKSVPFSNKVGIEKEKVFDIVRDIRLNLPNELRQAQRILDDRDKIINEAKIKASGIIDDAENTAQFMVSNHEVYKAASEQAEQLMETTRQNARDMRLNAMDYADELLSKTEGMIREAMINMDQQHQMMDDYFSQTVDILYANRQELRGVE